MARPDHDAERRRIFRRMEWLFVWAPPILAVLVTASAAAVLALFVPVLPGDSFWIRWLAAAGLLLVIPALMLLARRWFERQNR